MLGKLAGPVIGALIGYCTNYIAVKMLFYPKKEIRVWGHKLPFTPGAIPKGKPRLAKAVGDIVANSLLTEEDIKNRISSKETEDGVVDRIMEGLSKDIHTCVSMVCPSGLNYDTIKSSLVSKLSDQIMDSVKNMNLDELIVEEAGRTVKEKTKGTMVEMFLNDHMLDSLIQPVGGKVAEYIVEKGPDFIKKEISLKIDELEKQSVVELCENFDIDKPAVREIIASFYHKVMDSVIGRLISDIDIAGIVEEKINAMDVDSLEEMVLTVMKKELNMIVNLGALVGAVLGILNIFL